MSTTIDIENAKQIRTPMEIYCGISAENTTAYETISSISGISPGTVALQDSNATGSIKTFGWPELLLADLAGGGFPLDAGAQFVTTPHAGSASGKYGAQSDPAEGLEIIVSTNASAVSITADGEGYVEAYSGGQLLGTYPIQRQFVVPVPQNTSTQLLFINTSLLSRVIVYTIVPGVVMSFNNDNLISVTLDLAGDLSLEAPTLEASSIEINAYYPADISEIISSVSEDTPIWYYAGYDGDYCETRKFYISEDAVQANNVITIHGTDACARLCEKNKYSKLFHAGKTTGLGLYELYSYMKSIVTGAGITLAHFQKMTNPGGDYYSGEFVVALEQSVQDLFGAIMLEMHEYPQDYAPTYVDAGIPTLYHKRIASDGTYKSPNQLRVWTINEEDCADLERRIQKRVNWVYNSDTTSPLLVKMSAVGAVEYEEIAVKKKCVANGIYTQDAENYYQNIVVSNSKKLYTNSANKVKWAADHNGACSVHGRPLTETQYLFSDAYSGLTPRPGVEVYITPAFKGMFRRLTSSGYVSPDYQRMNASNIMGSFTFKGDPRMQPRDTFKFVRLDGTTEVATIERIEMTHEEGGTTATLHYRLGVM